MEDLSERTEEATPRRRQQARDEGQVTRSADFAAAIALLGAVVIVWAGLMPVMSKLAAMMRDGLGDAFASSTPQVAGEWATAVLVSASGIALPILVGAWLIAYASHVVQVGWLFAPAALQPRLSRVSPISGWRRIFSAVSLVKWGMDAAKVLGIFTAATFFALARADHLLRLPNLELGPALVVAGRIVLDMALAAALILLVLGFLDLAWQKWKHRRDLRMSRVEIREELKQAEGDPGIRRRRLHTRQRLAAEHIATSVARAHVVVTSPEVASIAIRYDGATMQAPRVVAKGRRLMAQRICELAEERGIPVIEREPLAVALDRGVQVGQEVAADSYQSIAEILAEVYSTRPSR
jgi:flagellar biosynthetic protein FlhB